jgi:ribonuclease P protein component
MLPAAQRLRKNEDFRIVYKRGRAHVSDLAVLHVLHRAGGDTEGAAGPRIGFVVSKKQGGAVERNRIKRRLREAVRLALPSLRAGSVDLIFVGRGRLKEADWCEVQAAVEDLLRRARLLVSPPPQGGAR